MKKISALLIMALFAVLPCLADTFTVYFDNSKNWENIGLFWWSGNLTPDTYPGNKFVVNHKPVEDVKKNDGTVVGHAYLVEIDGKSWYKFIFDNGSGDEFIISNGDNTNNTKAGGGNLKLTDGQYYNGDGINLNKTNSGNNHYEDNGDNGDNGDQAEKRHVYVSNAANWNTPLYAYIYQDGVGENAKWPGVQMTYNGALSYNNVAGLYVAEVPANLTAPRVIISSDGNRYPDDNVPGMEIGSSHCVFVTGNKFITPLDSPIEEGDNPVPPAPIVAGLSNTLPVIYINVYNDEEHTSFNGDMLNKDYLLKDEHKNATYYIDVPEGVNYDWAKAVGSADEQLPLSIKLRGNFTRSGLSKKPYKLKLGAKQGLLGLSKSKHFALIAHADDDKGFMRNFVGFELGKMMGLPWTPSQQPVEVVINGQYRGLYFLTESIRIEADRVNIEELLDGEEDKTLASGGYLVELDNYKEDPSIQFSIPEKGCVPAGYGDGAQIYDVLRVTFDTPEVYSDIQRRFIEQQFTAMNNLMEKLKSSEGDELWKYIDLDDAVRYYLVEELISHWEAYHGSTYMFRDRGADQKWHFSPLWDCGNAFGNDAGKYNYFYNIDMYGNTWIPSMRENSTFNSKLMETWRWFMSNHFDKIYDKIDEYAKIIDTASKYDAKYWDGMPIPNQTTDPVNGNTTNPQAVKVNNGVLDKASWVKDYMKQKVNWLKGQWGSYGSNEPEPARDVREAAALPDFMLENEEPPTPPTPSDKKMIYVADNAGWASNGEDLYAYYYADGKDNIGWPGDKLTYYPDLKYDNYTGLYACEVREGYENGYVMFSNKNSEGILTHRYPADNDPGMAMNGKHVFYVTGETSVANLDEPIVAEVMPDPWSGSLPVFFVTTDDGQPIPADKTKTTATWSLTYPDGTSATPNKNNILTIKGRGSDTWTNFDKKPYKIEFDKKQTVCGHTESKHFVLLPYLAGVDMNVMLYNIAGYEIARRAGLRWTPAETPVELVVNGEYLGLYFMTENVRPSVNRVPIGDYADWGDETVDLIYDLEADWLIEIDNTADDAVANYIWNEDGKTYKVVSSSPDFTDKKVTKNGHLETLQANLNNHMNNLLSVLDSSDDTAWEAVIDKDEAVAYYMVQELMDDPRAFDTAFFLWHTSGSKWMLGPVWDFSGAFSSQMGKDAILHSESSSSAVINKLYSRPSFKEALAEKFFEFSGRNRSEYQQARVAARSEAPLASVGDYLNEQAANIEAALEADAQVWPQYRLNDVKAQAAKVAEMLDNNAEYLAGQWAASNIGTGIADVEAVETVEYFDITGRRVVLPEEGGVYIRRQGSKTSKVIF